MKERIVGWDANREKLLALVVLDDTKAVQLTDTPGEAYFRAFIVEDRGDGRVSLRFRFRYEGKDSWYSVGPSDKPRLEAFDDYRAEITDIVLRVAWALGARISQSDITCWQPPDDEGHFERTIAWLTEKDLVHAPKVVRVAKPDSVN